jgi:hypothetical protein
MLETKIVTSDTIQTPTTHDAIVGNQLLKGVPDTTIYVQSESELSNFTEYPVGTFAIQYGFKGMWQLKPDKSWVSVI